MNEATRPYRLADWYGEFASGALQYPEIAAAFARLLRRFDSTADSVLEVACGTGSLTIPLARLGFDVTGLDISPDMLDVARRRSTAAGLAIPFVHRDLRNAGHGPPVDAVVCFYGGLNYLTSSEGLRDGLLAVRRALRPGGLFIFDQFSEDRMRRLFSGSAKVVREDVTVATRSRCLADGRIAHRLTVESKGVQRVEHHRLRIHPLYEIVRLLEETEFEVVHSVELSKELGSCLDLADDYLFVGRRREP